MNIVGRKNLYFILSAAVIIPGLISLFIYGLLPSIEFTGGSRLEISTGGAKILDTTSIKNELEKNGVKVATIKQLTDGNLTIRTEVIEQKTKDYSMEELKKTYPDFKEKSFETQGATIGNETKKNAVKAVIIASIVIALYIAFVFKEVSRPVSSWKFGICAIIALFHDVLVVVGVFSILGRFFAVEIDSLFITAILTIMGFSVHDTIVVFDRIRENIKKNITLSFPQVVNNSILETITRSINTSLTVLIVLSTLLLFGGESLRWFLLALLIGIVSGTYSSIFSAAPLLVLWYERDEARKAEA